MYTRRCIPAIYQEVYTGLYIPGGVNWAWWGRCTLGMVGRCTLGRVEYSRVGMVGIAGWGISGF